MEVSGTWRHVDVHQTDRRGAFRAARDGRRWALEDGHGQLLVVSDERRDFVNEARILARLPAGRGWCDQPAGLLLRPETWQFDNQSSWLRLDEGAPDSVADRSCTVRRFRVAPDLASFSLWTEDATGRYVRFEKEMNRGMPLSVRLNNIRDGNEVPDWAAKWFRLLDENVDYVPPPLTSTSASTDLAAHVLSEAIARFVSDGGLPDGSWSVQAVRDEPAVRSWTLAITGAVDRAAYIDCRDIDAVPYEQRMAKMQRHGVLYWQLAVDYEFTIPDDIAWTLAGRMRQHIVA